VKTPYTAPAGISSQVYPAVVGAAPSGVMKRNGVTRLTFAARYSIDAAPYVQDHNYYSSTVSAQPSPRVTQVFVGT
jgi:hypothetical protein